MICCFITSRPACFWFFLPFSFHPPFSPLSPPSCQICYCSPPASLLLCPKNLLFSTSPNVSFLPFFLLGIRLPWTPPRLCSSWWQRRACPACPPAWGRFTPTTATLTASSTSPTPRRRCSERLSQQQPGRPAEPGADKMNWTQTDGGDTTQPNWGKKGQTEPGLFLSSFFSPKLHFSLPHEPLWTFKHSKLLHPPFFMLCHLS